MSPPAPSVHVAYTTDLPSGVHAGADSTALPDVVRRFGMRSASSIVQTRPSDENATRRPSGERTGSRISRAITESPTSVEPFTSGPSDCSTSTLIGIAVLRPDGTSTRQSLPPIDVMIALPSGSHADDGNGPTPVTGGG